MIRSRKAESNVIAEILMVGIAVTLSMVVFFVITDDDTAGDFGSLTETLEASSEILSIAGLVPKCPQTEASVIVTNVGGLDANVKSIAINDATNRTNVDAKYANNASTISLVKGSTSDPLTNTQCNDSTYFNISSVFSGTTTEVVSNANFTNNINGWTSSSSVSSPLTKFYLTMFIPSDPWNGNQDYRELRLTEDNPDSDTIVSFGNKENKKFWFDPDTDSSSTGNPRNDPKGYGWRTANPLDGVISSDTWEFGLKLTATDIDEGTEGHIEIYVYAADPNDNNLNNADFLFSLDTSTNVLDEAFEGQAKNYTYTHNPGLQFDLSGKVLIVEYWLHVDENESGNNADLTLTIGSDSYVSIPIIPTIDAIVHDPLDGNPSPGSGAGSAKGVIADVTTYAAMGTVNYNFIYQFTTPEDFDSMAASYAWKYTEVNGDNTKLNFVRLIITDLNDNLITELHCDDNGAGTCDGTSGWQDSTSFNYRTGITSSYALDPLTNYRLVVHFQASNTVAAGLPVLTLRIDDVGLEFLDGQYESIAIFDGNFDASLSPSNLEFYFDSTFTKTGVNVSLQAYDYTISDYSTNNSGKRDYVFATPNSDYIVKKDLVPSKFSSNGQWKIKVTATNPTPFTISVDLIQVNAVVSKPVLREVVYLNNVVIEPGQTVLVNATLSRPLDSSTAYKVTIITERNSYSTVTLN